MSDTVKAVRLKTEAMAHLVIRNCTGHKLFDMNIPGVTVTITTPLNATIEIEPDERSA
jgi:hypothetical protein